MSSTEIGASQQVLAAVELITRTLNRLTDDASARATYCESQARAARDALLTVASEPSLQPSSITDVSGAQISGADDVGTMLAEAEFTITQLHPQVRNQTAVCAAMSFLRRARRGLAAS